MIDVSEFQGTISFGVMPKSTRVLIRVSYGSSGVDALGARNVSAALAAGLRVGPYHFLEDADPVAEMAHFFACMNSRLHDFRLRGMIDVEPSSFSHPTKSHVEAAVAEFHRRANYWPTIYGNRGVLDALNLSAGLARCPLIIADYGPNDGALHPIGGAIPAPWRTMDAHQYTSVGHYAGIRGNVDLNALSRGHHIDVARPRVIIDKWKVGYRPKGSTKRAHVWTRTPGLWVSAHRGARRRGFITIYPHRKEA